MISTDNDHTFISSGSFQGPLLDLRHPPGFGHEQVPPRKSGNWLLKPMYIMKECTLLFNNHTFAI